MSSASLSRQISERILNVARRRFKQILCKATETGRKCQEIFAERSKGLAERKSEVCDEARTGNSEETAEKKAEVYDEARTEEFKEEFEPKPEVAVVEILETQNEQNSEEIHEESTAEK